MTRRQDLYPHALGCPCGRCRRRPASRVAIGLGLLGAIVLVALGILGSVL